MLSKAQSELWKAMGCGPQWILRDQIDPMLPVALQKTTPLRNDPKPIAEPFKPKLVEKPAVTMVKPVIKRSESTPDEPLKRANVIKPHEAQVLARIETASWEELEKEVQSCRACPHGATRIQTVFGEGAQPVKLLLIGEAPGSEEDLQGVAFVGKSGQLLDNMLASIKYQRGIDVGIINVLKCRPEKNATPQPSDCQMCRPFLMRQIALMKPQMIVLLGAVATKTVLENPEIKMQEARGKVHHIKVDDREIPVIASYHPSYLLRKSEAKALAWRDMILMLKTIKAN